MDFKGQKDKVEQLVKTNFEFKQLYKEHTILESKLDELSKVKFVSPDDEKVRKELQKKKLAGKDRMEVILREFQSQK